MNVRLFGCGKFRRLNSERMDRALTAREQRYVDMHRGVCAECRRAEEEGGRALQMLRLAILEPESSPSFESRLLRRLQLDRVRARFGYWSPALFGAAIAGIAILAALQMIADSSRMPEIRIPGQAGPEMTRHDPVFPRLANPPSDAQPPR